VTPAIEADKLAAMSDDHATYRNPLTTRYAGQAMRTLFGDQRKFRTWRRLWLALAESQKALGLDISQAQLDEMAAHLDDIDFAKRPANSLATTPI
jgi:adenylosuccinate lyase